MRRLILVPLFAVCASTSYAQPATPPTPVGACIWADRVYSEGAVLCTGTKTPNVHLQCNLGKWAHAGTGICNGAPATDTK
jgi:hypothetical protein